MCVHVSQWSVSAGRHFEDMRAKTQVFLMHWTICMLPIWFLLICVPVIPPLSLCVSLHTDGEGMMECWRVNLWFPGSWSGFIRSGCDNTLADGPTKHLSYKRWSASKKPSWKKQSAKRRLFLEELCRLLVAGLILNPLIFFPPSTLDSVDVGLSSKKKLLLTHEILIRHGINQKTLSNVAQCFTTCFVVLQIWGQIPNFSVNIWILGKQLQTKLSCLRAGVLCLARVCVDNCRAGHGKPLPEKMNHGGKSVWDSQEERRIQAKYSSPTNQATMGNIKVSHSELSWLI